MPTFPRLDPKLDVIFKILFTSSEALLIGLLTAVLRPPSPIVRATVQNPELPKDFLDDKGAFLDIVVVLDDGSKIDVEMQASSAEDFRERALYYWAGLFFSQLVAGQGHDALVRVVSVLFLDYKEFDFLHFHEIFRLSGDASGAVFTPLQEIHTIELPKLTWALAQTAGADEQALVRWCRFFSSNDAQELKTLAKVDPMIEEAEKKLAEISADPALREIAAERQRREIAGILSHGAARRKGRAEGQRDFLQQLIVKKFGELPAHLAARLGSANEPELTHWAERLLDASTLDDVFA